MIAESVAGKRVVVAACRRATGEGVRVGMTVAHASAILESPRVVDHAPSADAAALMRLGRWATRFTPSVALDSPDGLMLDVRGCERLYGGLLPLARQVRSAVVALRLQVRVAIAPTVGLAWGLARFGDEGVCDDASDLLDLPVAALRADAATVVALAEVGVDRVGQLADIPRGELARRFGDDLLLRLDQARGEAAEPLEYLRFAETPRVSFRFAGPTTQWEAVERTVQNLVEELCGVLAKGESAARRVILEVERLDSDLRPVFASLAFSFAHASRDARHLWHVLRPGVEALDMGRGVEALELVAADVARLPHGQPRLDGGRDASQDDRDLARVVDLLQGRLGRRRVLRYEPTPAHVPEAAYALVPASEPYPPKRIWQETLILGDRPSVLLDPPERAEVALLNPEGPLVTIRWRGESRRVLTTVGPERIGRRWWHFDLSRRSLAVRDYYKLQDEAGRWLWAFRALPGGRWFVHGVWS